MNSNFTVDPIVTRQFPPPPPPHVTTMTSNSDLFSTISVTEGDDYAVHHPKEPLPMNEFFNANGDPLIQIGFWGPSSTDSPFDQPDGCWFSMASYWTKRPDAGLVSSFTHCEIRFANRYVCSIHEYNKIRKAPYADPVTEKGVVHCRIRELDRRDYFFIELPVTKTQHDAMFRFACDYASEKIPFNKAGLLLNFVCPFNWCPVEKHEKAFFCSELIATLLHKAEVITDKDTLHPSTTSPNDLWAYLADKDNAFSSFNRNTSATEMFNNLDVPPPRKSFPGKKFSVPGTRK